MPHYGTATQKVEVDPKTSSKDHVSLRKRLRKEAQRKYPESEFFWAGGVLYFGSAANAQWPQEVPGVQHVPKSGHEAVGWAFAHNESHHQAYAEPARSTDYSYRSSGGSAWRW